MPAGYTPEYMPYFGKTAIIKPQPFGMTTDGLRYYSPEGKLGEGSRNTIAGYDNAGQPFYVPRGCTLPPPVGFTTDGIAFYDIPSLMHHRGIMILPTAKADRVNWPVFEDEENDTGLPFGDDSDGDDDRRQRPEREPKLTRLKRKIDPETLTNDLIATLEATQPETKQAPLKGRPRAVGTVHRLREFASMGEETDILADIDESVIADPTDTVAFLKENDSGKKLAFCSLVALRQSFVKITPSLIDAGWILPEKKKEVFLKAENVSNVTVLITFELQSEVEEQTTKAAATAALSEEQAKTIEIEVMKSSPFTLTLRNLRLQPGESKQITVLFEPLNLGRFSDILVVNGPGGDLIRVNLQGVAGIPIALYPEGRENSLAGSEALTRERCEFMKKFKRTENSFARTHIPLSDQDVMIIQNMMSATADTDSRKEAHTLDFGICYGDVQTVMRCVTIMNLSDNPITIGMFPHNPAVTCPYLVRIPPRMANTIEVTLNLGEGQSALKGNILSAIEVICPEFQNIPLYVLAFIGQPLFFPSWDFSFFKPCLIGETEQLIMNLVNESQYDIFFTLSGLAQSKRTEFSNLFTSSVSTDPSEPTKVIAYSMMPVTFIFTARQRGPLMSMISLNLVKPFSAEFPGAISGNPLAIIGMCVEPYAHKAGELPDKNGIEFIRMWMSHPKRLIDEYPKEDSDREKRFDVISGASAAKRKSSDAPTCEISFYRDVLIFRQPRIDHGGDDAHVRRSQIVPVMVQHKGTKELLTDFFASTLFNIDPRARDMKKGDNVSFDVMFTPPHDAKDNITTYGFGLALVQEDHTFHAVQLIGKPFTDFILFPVVGSDGNVVLDFGRIEASSQALDINTKHVVLCNSHSAPYSWNLKFTSSKTKFNAFEAGMNFGELHPYEAFALPFKFHCETSGVFESYADISIKETMDRLAKNLKITNIVLRGQTVNTSLTGFPDSLDFGSTVVNYKKRKRFTVSNNGTTDCKITLLTRPPFTAHPKAFQLSPKASQEVSVTFTPTESRTSTVKMLIFSNQKLYIVPMTGSGGTAELTCEKYESKDIDFGHQREGTVAWLSVYLTNKGTLPLILKAVTAEIPELIKLEYVAVTSTVPYEGNQGKQKAYVSIRRDYWGILRRKMRVFAILNSLTRKHISDTGLRGERRILGGKAEEEGVSIVVARKGSISIVDQSLAHTIPPLRPFYSYHLRLGYLNKYQPKKDTEVQFHYMPITTDEETANIGALLKSMTVRVIGSVYRTLEFFPPFHDFGLAPAEAWSVVDVRRSHQTSMENYGVIKTGHVDNGAVVVLQVLNMSMEAQNLSLQFINSEFTVNGRQWQVYPGEKLQIPIEFHPSKEQLQYRGEARFNHTYGVQMIRLTGTGASSDLSVDDVLDFGSLKIGSTGMRSLRLCNRGLLECKYRLEIFQAGTDYRLIYGEPFEHEGIVASGAADNLEIECACQHELEQSAYISVKWERIPGGVWEEAIIPIKVQIGVPMFHLDSFELDFQTTYINVNKTLEFEIVNDGNAACNWSAESRSPLVIIDPDYGTIEPDEIITVEATYIPENYDPLSSEISFVTDAGPKTLMCYGIVGIPYLMIPEDCMNINFGITAIDKIHTKPAVFTNTSVKGIEYEIIISDLIQDGVLAPSDEFEVFFANPTHGVIGPNSSATINFQAVPKHYNSTVSATFTVRTRDGEQYVGHMQATGGKAIIKIAPPTVVEEVGTKSIMAEMKQVKPPSRGKISSPQASAFETARLAFQSHIENLQDVLAGLRTAEMEVEKNERAKSRGAKGAGTLASPKTKDYDFDDREEKHSAGKRTGSGKTGSGRGKASQEEYKDYDNLIDLLVKSRRETPKEGRESSRGSDRTGSRSSKNRSKPDTAADSTDDERGLTPERRALVGSQRSRRSDKARDKMNAIEAAILDKADEEQKKRIAIGGKVFDGSDLRSRVKRAAGSTLTADKSHDGHAGADDDSELVGKRTGSGRVRLTPINGTDFPRRGNSESETEAEPRTPPRNSASARRRQQALADDHQSIEESTAVKYLDQLSSLEAELEAISGSITALAPGSLTSSGGLGRYNPGTPRRGFNSREGRGLPNQARRTISRGGAEKDGSDPTERGELDNLRRPVEDLMALAQQMVSDTSATVDLKLQKQIIEEMNNKIIESTRGVIKAVKDQLSNRWIVNREFLSSALRKVQQTTHVMEALSVSGPPPEKLENDFSLGLVRGGDRSPSMLLFHLPNMGNLAFDFQIVMDENVSLRPSEFDPEDKTVEMFTLDPASGEIQPNGGVNIAASFMARVTGLYQQGYDVISSGEKVLSFTVTAKVGNPKIRLDPGELDYGLIKRNKSEVRTLVVSNVGTFRDYWRIEPITVAKLNDDEVFSNVETLKPAFTFTLLRGELEIGDAVPINVTFCPPQEGRFDYRVRLIWSGEPQLVNIVGTGGGARMKAVFLNPADVKFGGLDWGVCIVGVRSERTFQLTNVGNVDGHIKLSHANTAIKFDIEPDSNGEIRVPAGAFVNVNVIYVPVQTELIKEALQVELADMPLLLIPMRAQAGVCEWQIGGDLSLKNMPMTDIQISSLTVTNVGGLDIPFEWRMELEDESVRPIIKIVVKEAKLSNMEIILKPRQTIKIDITVTPKEHQHCLGSLVLTTNLGRGKVTKVFPIDFFAYADQVALDSEKDASVGRIMVGQTAEVLRNLTNFGSERVKFRLRLETVTSDKDKDKDKDDPYGSMAAIVTEASKKKKSRMPAKIKSKLLDSTNDLKRFKSPWKIKGFTDGFIEPGQVMDIAAVFESVDEDGDEWHEARLIVERCDDELKDNWVELTSIKLLGAGGTPKLLLDPEVVQFSHQGIGFDKFASTVFRNEVGFFRHATKPDCMLQGSALLEYEILSPWDFDGNMFIKDGTPLSGKIDAQESQEICFRFRPTEVLDYETVISIKTQVDTKTLKLVGQGASYQFYKESLPNVLQFGAVAFGTMHELPLTVHNDCAFPITVRWETTSNDPDSGEERKPSECLSLTPESLSIPANAVLPPPATLAERQKGEFKICLLIPIPLDDDGVGDSKEIMALLQKGTKRHFIRLQTVNGSGLIGSQVIPVTFSCCTNNILAITTSKYEQMHVQHPDSLIPENEGMTELNFGEIGMATGSTVTFVLYNPNMFKVLFEAVSTDKQFEVSATKGTIPPQGFRELRVEFKSIIVTDEDENVPQSVSYTGQLQITTNIPTIPGFTMAVNGVLVDETPALDFSIPIDFGSVKKLFTSDKFIEFRNPVRRPLPYKFYVERPYADVFQTPGGVVNGIAKPRQLVRIPIKFLPKQGVAYRANSFLETSEGNHVIELRGSGVEVAVNVDKKKVEFGVVGVGAPEFRNVTVSNPSSLPVRVAIQSDNAQFTTNMPEEITIGPGETKDIRLIFSPTQQARLHTAQVNVMNLDLRPGQREPDILAKVDLLGTGGVHEFTVGNMDDDPDADDPMFNSDSFKPAKKKKVSARRRIVPASAKGTPGASADARKATGST
ncbi:Cilia- and flagella-associated protein 47, partial [Irineochytrium annulatum]